MGIGISMYYVSGLGSDPISTFMEAISILTGLASGTVSILMNLLILVVFFCVKSKRGMINIGSFVQTFCVGVGINGGMDFWYSVLPQNMGLVGNLTLSVVGAVLIGISLALYLPCDMGASATDIMILTVCGIIKKSYKWGFYIVYALFMVAGILLGGTWGLGTVVALILTGFTADLLMPRTRALFTKWFTKVEPAVQGA